jgi:hypothetical protein
MYRVRPFFSAPAFLLLLVLLLLSRMAVLNGIPLSVFSAPGDETLTLASVGAAVHEKPFLAANVDASHRFFSDFTGGVATDIAALQLLAASYTSTHASLLSRLVPTFDRHFSLLTSAAKTGVALGSAAPQSVATLAENIPATVALIARAFPHTPLESAAAFNFYGEGDDSFGSSDWGDWSWSPSGSQPGYSTDQSSFQTYPAYTGGWVPGPESLPESGANSWWNETADMIGSWFSSASQDQDVPPPIFGDDALKSGNLENRGNETPDEAEEKDEERRAERIPAPDSCINSPLGCPDDVKEAWACPAGTKDVNGRCYEMVGLQDIPRGQRPPVFVEKEGVEDMKRLGYDCEPGIPGQYLCTETIPPEWLRKEPDMAKENQQSAQNWWGSDTAAKDGKSLWGGFTESVTDAWGSVTGGVISLFGF